MLLQVIFPLGTRRQGGAEESSVHAPLNQLIPPAISSCLARGDATHCPDCAGADLQQVRKPSLEGRKARIPHAPEQTVRGNESKTSVVGGARVHGNYGFTNLSLCEPYYIARNGAKN